MKKLAILLLLCASAVRADTYQPQVGPYYPTFDLPGQLTAGEELYIPQIFDLGGILDGWMYISDSQLDAVLEINKIVAYPAGFLLDPNLDFNSQWPYSIRDYVTFFNINEARIETTALATPEPGSGIFTIFGMTMIGLLAMLGWSKRIERLYR